MTENAYTKNSGFHYGWIIVLGGFLTQVVLLIAIQTLPIVLPNIEETLGIAHAAAGTIVSVFGLCYAGFSFFWGFLSDKVGTRTAITLAGLVASLMLVAFGLTADSLVKAIILYALVGFGCAGIYSATIPKLIGEWFTPSKRGRAMSLITPGGVITGAVLGILVPRLAGKYGWESTFTILGTVAVIVTIIICIIIKNRPEEMGLRPVGESQETSVQQSVKVEAGREQTTYTSLDVLKMKITWHLGTMYIFWQLGYMACTAFLAAAVVAAGYDAKTAGLAVTIYNLFQLVGQQIWGPLSDRWERKRVIGISNCWWGIFAFGFILSYGKSLGLLYVMIALMGIGIGNVPVLLAAFSDYYPKEIRGTGTGVISTLATIGRFFGPLLAGIIADAAGNLTSAFAFAAIMMFVAALIAATLPRIRSQAA